MRQRGSAFSSFGTCFFCGEDESNVVDCDRRRDERGRLLEWMVCLACGTSNVRHIREAQEPPAGDDHRP
ncbi:hypothetical protein ACWGB8_02635 [Kitasatospora sp. NPDC054939]